MCVIALAHRAVARYALVVAANRDESHGRAASPAAWWPDRPGVLGGRDLEAGGTWLAVNRSGRFSAVTNLRAAALPSAGAPSRGLLVGTFVAGRARAAEFAADLEPDAARYAPFNLLCYDGAELCYTSNLAPTQRLEPGFHAFSNARAGTRWPKIDRAVEGLAAALEEADPAEALFALLRETAPAAAGFDARQTSLFQRDSAWGTRCSTVVLVDALGAARFIERRFDAAGQPAGESAYSWVMAGDGSARSPHDS